MISLVRKAWHTLFVETYRAAESEAASSLVASPGPTGAPSHGAGREAAVVLVTAALTLTFLNYAGTRGNHAPLLAGLETLGWTTAAAKLAALFQHPETAELARLAFWVASCVVSYVLIPLVALRLFVGRPIGEYGLRVAGMKGHLWIYVAMFLCMVPAVAAVSFTESFQSKYPFYRLQPGERLWPYFACWELLYAVQFVALEFFFRGFLVHGTRRRLGYYSVLVMTVPYTMIHFQKPALETLGAVAAGIVLGTLSLKTRSIWWGAGLHIAVAYTMDFAALWQRGFWQFSPMLP